MVFVFLLKETFIRSAALVIMGSNATLIGDRQHQVPYLPFRQMLMWGVAKL